jgi:3-hydroxy acid dehydrogenase/malonic semialdehyde reductase
LEKPVPLSLKNKTVFITGASAGIGAATALEFAKQGCRLLLCARRLDKLQELEVQLLGAGAAEVFSFKLDVRNRDEVEGTWATLPAAWRDVDILVNNAGLSRGLAKLYEDSVDDWEEMIDTNIKGLLYVLRSVVPQMVERNSGHVIQLGSIAGHIVYPKGGVYCATKAAVNFIGDGLRIDLNGTDIRVTSIDPGMVETDFSLTRFRGDEARAAKTYENVTPLSAEDIADAIVYAATRPAHMQVQTMVLTCVAQANPYVITRKG